MNLTWKTYHSEHKKELTARKSPPRAHHKCDEKRSWLDELLERWVIAGCVFTDWLIAFRPYLNMKSHMRYGAHYDWWASASLGCMESGLRPVCIYERQMLRNSTYRSYRRVMLIILYINKTLYNTHCINPKYHTRENIIKM